MNKFSLEENQLQRVKYFIWQKGIQDADAIHEVIDHFACKVEELMNENMYLPLDKAMQAAYFSFGKDGFKIIVEQYIKTVKKQFWCAYKLSFKEFIKTNRFSFAVIWMAFLCGFVYYSNTNPENWQYDFCFYLIIASFIAAIGLFFYLFFIKEDKYTFSFTERKGLLTWQKTVRSIPKLATLNIFTIISLNALKLEFLWIMYIYILLSSFSVLDLIIRINTAKKLSQKLSF